LVDLDLRRFAPPADPRGALFLEPSAALSPGVFSAAAWVSYAQRSVRLEDARDTAGVVPVEHQTSIDYLLALGVTDRVALTLALASVVAQSGEDSSALDAAAAALPSAALGDLSLGTKLTLVRPRVAVHAEGLPPGFGIAMLGRLVLPTGRAGAFVSERSVAGGARFLADYRFLRVGLAATGGVHFRSEEREYGGVLFGSELPWGVGADVILHRTTYGGRISVLPELRGFVPWVDAKLDADNASVVSALSARYSVGDFSILGGAELPVQRSLGTPNVRGVLSFAWVPSFQDQDKDGLEDAEDACALASEDADGFEDADGCPDLDDDGDRVRDAQDRCPRDPEDHDGFEDGDGCADLDDDQDGLNDEADACPREAGPVELRGCPVRDADRDGVLDSNDRCRSEAEDKDGFQDADGCPEPDNDGDGVMDGLDACPTEAGPASSEPTKSGCPTRDADGDLSEDAGDRCPNDPEDFDGDADEDGCPEAEPVRAPLVQLRTRPSADSVLTWKSAPAFAVRSGVVSLTPESQPTLRALAAILRQHPSAVFLVGVRPLGNSNEARTAALARAFILADELRRLAQRDGAAEPVAWDAVSQEPNARGGVGIAVVGSPLQPTAAAPTGRADD
jgi:hypothetical protein